MGYCAVARFPEHAPRLYIAWNQTLTNIWAGAHDFSTPSRLQTALPGNVWDIVELQPWYETWIDAATAGSNMVRLTLQTSPNAKILIFACGPESSQGPYLTTWNRTDQQNYTQPNFWKSKLNYELIVNSLRTNFPGTQIGLVPMGHCIARVATLLQSGTNIPGVTSVNDLLEQGGHPADEPWHAQGAQNIRHALQKIKIWAPPDLGPLSLALADQMTHSERD